MANARELLKRKKSVQSTGKITRTMELVASAKLKKAQDAAAASVPYAEGLADMLAGLAAASGDYQHPLMQGNDQAQTVAVMVACSDRGLCGAFNGNLVRKAIERIQFYRAQGKQVRLIALSRKAATTLRFFRESVDEAHRGLVEKVDYAEVTSVIEPVIADFLNGKLASVEVIYSHFYNVARQAPEALTLLPAGAAPAGAEGDVVNQTQYIFHPDPVQLLDTLVPQAVRVRFFSTLLQTAAGEHAARRVAMKNATDAAKDLAKAINSKYNRARQGKITQEIAEIVGAVEAMS